MNSPPIIRPGMRHLFTLPLGAEVLGMTATTDGRVIIATTQGAFSVDVDGNVTPIEPDKDASPPWNA